jgi:hypothetical protein
VLADPRTVSDVKALRAAVDALDAELTMVEVAEEDGSGGIAPRHDHERLAAAYRGIFEKG